MNTRPAAALPRLRHLCAADLDRMVEIEQAAYPFPWTRGIFADCLRAGYDARGLEIGEWLAGYFVQMRVAGESHLLNLCIAPQCQGRGYGRVLLDHAIEIADSAGCFGLFLEVRPSNKAAIALYRKRGFYRIGDRPQYYRAARGRENALVMRLDLPADGRA